jgi:uncharacterized protein (DUF934 family)
MIIITEDGFGADPWQEIPFFRFDERPKGQFFILDLDGDSDPEPILPHLAEFDGININFPSAQDGRGFSLARWLRDDGFKGRLRATGPLMTDQYRHARQSGFDEVAITADHAKRMTEKSWFDVINLPLPNYQKRLMSYK